MNAQHALAAVAAPLALAAAGTFAVASSSAPTAGAGIGSPLPDDFAPEGFAQTGAEGMEDYLGRVVLIEYFAHW